MKVQVESFHLNGHIIGFRLQTQKLESPYKTPSNNLAVKGLMKEERGDQSEQFQLLDDIFPPVFALFAPTGKCFF